MEQECGSDARSSGGETHTEGLGSVQHKVTLRGVSCIVSVLFLVAYALVPRLLQMNDVIYTCTCYAYM